MIDIDKDYLITVNLKNTKIKSDKTIFFYNTDLNICNIFIKLICTDEDKTIPDDLIVEFAVLKPETNEFKPLDATLISKEDLLYQVDLTTDYLDIIGTYECEIRVSGTIDNETKCFTSESFDYVVKPNITAKLNNQIKQDKNLPILEKLIKEVNDIGLGIEMNQVQLKKDDNLVGDNKTIVGAINQLREDVNSGLGGGKVELKDYQKKTDDNLATEEKTIVGAVNEINNKTITLEKDDTSFNGIDDTIHNELNTTDKTIIGGINEINSQCKDIANLFTTEQTTNFYKIKCGNKVIAEIPLGSTTPTVIKYTIKNTLSNATNSNNAIEIEENQSYNATITAITGYTLKGATVNIVMGGTDITNNVYNEGHINIPKVTGNLVINISAINIPKDFITNGLVFNLELRNRTSENNSTNPPIIADTIHNKECITHNIDWDGKTSGFVDNGLLLKDPSTIENANSYKESTYSTLEIPKFDDTYDFPNGFTIEFTLSGHKGGGIARTYGTVNEAYGIGLYNIERNLTECFTEYINTDNKVKIAQLTYNMPTNDVVYNEDEHTYSIAVDNKMNASSYLDGQLIDTLNNTTVSNFKKLFFTEIIKVAPLFVGFLYQNTNSRNFILSEMRLYNKVLSSDEINSNYCKTLSLQTLSNFQ